VDCGITAVREIKRAREHGIDVIVCDHHKPETQLPHACALINAKIPGCAYPFKELAGVGVGFKLLNALYAKLNRPRAEIHADLDLVALGTVVDIVPLVDENRTMVKYGMNKLLKSKKAGFQALLAETGLKKGVTAYHLGFIIGPRVNACGRLHDAHEALDMFLVDDKEVAREHARNLSRHDQFLVSTLRAPWAHVTRCSLHSAGTPRPPVLSLTGNTYLNSARVLTATRKTVTQRYSPRKRCMT